MTTYNSTAPRKGALGLLFLLGALTAFDSIAIDMYLPAFTAMETELSLAAGIMPMSLSVFLIGLAVGQAVCGPLADSLGRRGPLLAGILLFGAASCLVALSSKRCLRITTAKALIKSHNRHRISSVRGCYGFYEGITCAGNFPLLWGLRVSAHENEFAQQGKLLGAVGSVGIIDMLPGARYLHQCAGVSLWPSLQSFSQKTPRTRNKGMLFGNASIDAAYSSNTYE